MEYDLPGTGVPIMRLTFTADEARDLCDAARADLRHYPGDPSYDPGLTWVIGGATAQMHRRFIDRYTDVAGRGDAAFGCEISATDVRVLRVMANSLHALCVQRLMGGADDADVEAICDLEEELRVADDVRKAGPVPDYPPFI